MALFKKTCVFDPGSCSFRLYDPESRQTCSLRSCLAVQDQKVLCSEEAIRASMSDPFLRLRYPYSQGQALMDIFPLFDRLVSETRQKTGTPASSILIVHAEDASESEKMKLQNLAIDAGFRKISFASTMDVLSRDFSLVIHAGHSCTEIGVRHGRKNLIYKKIIYGAQQMDEAIMDLIASKYRALLFAEDAAALRRAASNAFWENRNPILSCTVLDQSNQYVRISFPAIDLWPAMQSVLDQIVLWVKTLIARNGPDLMERILRRPILLSGGLSECFGLSQLLEQELHKKITIVPGGEECLIRAACSKKFI